MRPPSACLVFICLCIVLSFAAVPAFAQPAAGRSGGNGAEPAVPEKVGKELQAFYVGESAPHIDGRLESARPPTNSACRDNQGKSALFQCEALVALPSGTSRAARGTVRRGLPGTDQAATIRVFLAHSVKVVTNPTFTSGNRT